MDSKLSYTVRLYLWLVCYSLLMAGCIVGFQYHREKQFKTEELNARLQMLNLHILDNLSRGEDIAGIAASRLNPFEELRISVIDSGGRVVYDNGLNTVPEINHRERREISEAMATGAGYTVRRHSESTGNTYFYSATLGDDGCIVRTAVPYSVSLVETLKTDYRFVWVMGGITLIMCVAGYFATRRLGVSIKRLNKFAARAERGERIYDTAPFPKDELGSISNHIVRLYATLQNAIAERDKEHKAALTEQREKERIKKQLTNNINHELKTPVASIQVCLETLAAHKDIPEEKRSEFLARCLDNTARLRSLLNDVSLITRMDDAPSSIEKEPVDLSEIISGVVEDCDAIIRAAGFEVENGVSGAVMINGNRPLLISVIRNLIDNALAYSGGDRIVIDVAGVSAGKITLRVYDNGCGVAPEHLPHIFERFYRIDKGRSRSAGGTGLGLSIVKNTVILHGGSITAFNRPAGGLEFTIEFPTL